MYFFVFLQHLVAHYIIHHTYVYKGYSCRYEKTPPFHISCRADTPRYTASTGAGNKFFIFYIIYRRTRTGKCLLFR